MRIESSNRPIFRPFVKVIGDMLPGRRSCGSIRHWLPVRVRYMSAFIISRRSTVRGRPVSAHTVTIGAISSHSTSVRSLALGRSGALLTATIRSHPNATSPAAPRYRTLPDSASRRHPRSLRRALRSPELSAVPSLSRPIATPGAHPARPATPALSSSSTNPTCRNMGRDPILACQAPLNTKPFRHSHSSSVPPEHCFRTWYNGVVLRSDRHVITSII